ncbi:uncharacterized protein K444DRAFT_571426 [Hyaloscypha bicolor E]|uniref:DUF6594 domain-containing protein n=1 Tax=Hyaloscypha bicolor E TaxID=1095630 RepID=A0A2J6SRN8_9HELO|nr:uncharacterized protein K444DRAFT_571426 [Hyaloscypha bicolor E]PMD53446.1 hypothetical protein K444DRAFT_571426 [Hyaloscypha bicolor E]
MIEIRRTCNLSGTLGAQAADIDLEKANGISGERPYSSSSESTWESQNDIWSFPNSPTGERIVVDEDSDEESVQVQEPTSHTNRFLRAITPRYFTKPSFRPFRSIARKLERCGDGYPYLATFLDSDENFMIYRRFGFLHARLLLQKQDELRIMEEELDQMDQRDKVHNTKALQCRMEDVERQDRVVGETRQALLSRIENTILIYDELLLKAQQLAASNRPPERDYNSVANFVHDKKPLMQGDDDFIYHKGDLITLRPRRGRAWLDAAVEKILKLFPRTAVKYVFCSKETSAKTTDVSTFLDIKPRVNRIVSFAVMIMVLTLLVVTMSTDILQYSKIPDTNDYEEDYSSAALKLWVIVTLPFTALTFLAWWVLYWWAYRKQHVKAMIEKRERMNKGGLVNIV